MPRTLAAMLVAAAVAAPAPARAQSLSNGAISGRVVSEAGEPLRDVAISLTDPTTGIGQTVRSSASGAFTLRFLPPGGYALRAELLGYTPLVVDALVVRAERTVDLDMMLRPATPPFAEVDSLTAPAAAAKQRASVAEPLWDRGWWGLPDAERDVAQLLRAGTLGDVRLSPLLGEPGAYIDGFRVRSGVRSPVPLSALSTAELAAGPVDVEYAGAAAPLLVQHSVRGGNRMSADALGAFGAGGLFSSPDFDAGRADPSQLRGVLRMGGPILGDSAQAAVAFEVDRGTAPVWTDFAAEAALQPWQDAAQARGTELGRAFGVRGAASNAARGFARLDWQLAAGHELSVRGFMASETTPVTAPSAAWLGATSALTETIGVLAGLTSQFEGDIANELRVHFQTASDERTAVDSIGVPAFLVPLGAGVGTRGAGAGRTALNAIGFTETVHYRRGNHQLKAGVLYESARYERQDPRRSAYWFGGADLLEAGTGYFRTRATVAVPDFTVVRSGAFVQDRWTAARGLDIIVGARFDRENLPNALFSADTGFLRLAGLPPLAMQNRIRKLSPRAGFVWDVDARGDWVLNGSIGVYHEEFPVALLAEIVARDRGVETGTFAGTAASWPGAAPTGVTTATELTLVPPAIDAPRTTRGALGVTRALGRSTTLGVSLIGASTDYLPRRIDLNLDPVPVAEDQYGRPILGELVQQGELVFAAPGSNRRFRDFDMVSVVQTDGTSVYRAASVSVERFAGERLRLIARYTWSATEDDWYGAGAGEPAALLPPALPPGEAARRETSDFDVPHRAAVAGVLTLPVGSGGAELGVTYRRRSGRPFTPGLVPGVDVDGDGSGSNDAVFIDDTLPGMTELLDAHACLRNQAGGWATRNSCRADAAQALDARFGFGLRLAGAPVHLFVEAVNLIGGAADVVDAAVYRIDPAGELVRENGTVLVPYVVNANFGQPSMRRASPRVLRLGLQLRY
jgi:hypothetical protein